MRIAFFMMLCLAATRGMADVSVVASVDQNRVTFGESVALTIAVQGAQNVPQPAIPPVDGLTFSGPSMQTSVSIVNGAMSQSANLVYQVTPNRPGEFSIPPIEVTIAGKTYRTEPIKLTVVKGETQSDLQEALFGRVRLDSQKIYLGQTAPLDVILFSRANVPLKGVGGYTFQADGVGYKFLQNLKSGTKIINGETFNVHVIE